MLRKSWLSSSVQWDMHKYALESVFGAQTHWTRETKRRLVLISFVSSLHSWRGGSASRTPSLWSWCMQKLVTPPASLESGQKREKSVTGSETQKLPYWNAAQEICQRKGDTEVNKPVVTYSDKIVLPRHLLNFQEYAGLCNFSAASNEVSYLRFQSGQRT